MSGKNEKKLTGIVAMSGKNEKSKIDKWVKDKK